MVHLFHLYKLLNQMDFDKMMKINDLIDLKIDNVHQNLDQLLNHHLNENEYEILLLNELLNKEKENFYNHNK